MRGSEGKSRHRVPLLLPSPRFRLAVLGVIVVGIATGIAFIGGPDRQGIQELVRAAGPAAPVGFVALYVLLTVLLLPGAVMTITGGLLFGPFWGTVLSVVAATAGATLSFLIGRRLGRRPVEQIAGRRIGRFDRWLERRGFLAVLYLRLVPLVPFNVFNYAAGVTALRLRDYVIATAFGIVPGAFAYAALGGSFDDPTSPLFLVAVALLVVLVVAGPLVNRALRRRGSAPPGLGEVSR